MKKDLTKHTRSAWKQPVWWKYIVAFFIILINALPLYVLIEMSLKQSTDLASRLTWPDYIYLGNYLKILKNAGQSNRSTSKRKGGIRWQAEKPEMSAL